jgi:hypothetical protein
MVQLNTFRTRKDHTNPKRGQIAILLAMSFSILALLAAMVINISFLVTAKINLQNATDMAAYAGAVQQARYLTEIGKWNYEMRRNYKAMVYDLLVAYNAERDEPELKKYINNGGSNQQDKSPVICATLQRTAGGPVTNQGHEKTCQTIPYNEFQDAINASNQSALSAGASAVEACAIDPASALCLATITQAASAMASAINVQATAITYDNKYVNYKPGSDKHNYNRRLIAWTLHAYRHLQARIRGVHYGNISSSIDNRFEIGKNTQNMEINFKNSPISVAAKVINGFTDPGTPVAELNPVMKLEGADILKNPVHNAASQTFKNNLLDIISAGASIFAIKPNEPDVDSASTDMSGGCNAQCQEYKGPYLRLQQHDLSFPLTYITIKQNSSLAGGGQSNPEQTLVNAFPVGVAKDARVLTYYAVVGIADVADVPFNVFFGGGNTSEAPLMISVAAARPFGSRIGPFIDDTCNYNNFKLGQVACHNTGLDKLYPSTLGQAPNFSILETGDVRALGVKLTVDRIEHSKPQEGDMKLPTSNPANQTALYARTKGPKSRNRYYVRSNPTKDDGHNGNPDSDGEYYEKSSGNYPVPPQGNKNSIFAWPAKSGDLVAGFNADQNKKKSFEAYLQHFGGMAISSTGEDPARLINSTEKYKVYVFKYPLYVSNDWDINGLSLRTGDANYKNNMEKSFARTMAVNEFEIKRYIIPYHTDKDAYNKLILNYISSDANKIPFIHAGSDNRGTIAGTPMVKGGGNKPITDHIKKEDNDVFEKGGGPFPEYYTAWRTGIRGYRVKLTNIQDLLKNSGIRNPLPDSVNIEDEGITIDLRKINY